MGVKKVKLLIGFLVLGFLFVSCNMGSDQFKIKLPPKVEKKVQKINKQIAKIENELKFMVLDKEKAVGGRKLRYIEKQKMLKRRMAKFKRRREILIDKYAIKTVEE
jgi:hypothetical protein